MDRKYVTSKTHVNMPRENLFHYLIDSEDEEWLNIINSKKSEEDLMLITKETFLKVMNLFEIDAYKVVLKLSSINKTLGNSR